MNSLLRYSIKIFSIWLLYFLLSQALFLLSFYDLWKDESIFNVLYSFKSGMGLNISAAAYCTLIPVIFLYGFSWLKKNPTKLIFIYFNLILAICFLILATDLGLYQNWGTRINGKALWYLQFPGTIAASTGNLNHLKFIISSFILSLTIWFLYKKYFYKVLISTKPALIETSLFLGILGLLFIGIRGGIKGKPIHKSEAYYSSHQVLNAAATNGFWNFFDIISHYKSQGNPYNFFNEVQMLHFDQQVNNLNNFIAPKLSTTNKPNILIIFLESWGADVVGCLDGQALVTPGFDLLAKEGLLFNRFYSTGFRTEQGLMAVLSGFPAQAQTFPMEELERFENYPNLIKSLGAYGYYTSYFTGGNPQFANTDVYFQSAGIDKINKDLLIKAKRKSAWGALDEETFDWVLKGLNSQPQPFFSTAVTLTSHEWFEADVKKIFKEPDFVAANYKNTVHYTDSCLLDFIIKAKQQKWYDNTLILIMADHACNYPLNRSLNDPERYHIPMLICGGGMKEEYRGVVNSNYTGHLNIPNLICSEVGISGNQFIGSFHPFNQNSKSYFTYDHGVGVISKNNSIVFDFNLNNYIYKKPSTDSLLSYGKYLLQKSAQLKEEAKTKK